MSTRTRFRNDFMVCLLVMLTYAAGALALTSAAQAAPYGTGAPNWSDPPDGMVDLKPGRTVTLPRDAMDVDIWTVHHGEAYYRLRQRLDRSCDGCTQWSFTRARSQRTFAGYVGINRDVFSFTKRTTLRIYYWKG